MIVTFVNENLKKFKMTGKISADSILKFYEDFLDGSLLPVLKSEDIPE